MRRTLLRILIATCLTLATSFLFAQQAPIVTEHGTYAVHLILRTIGTEEYTLASLGTHQQLVITTNTSDRGNKRTITSTLDMLPDFSPTRFEQHIITPATATSPASNITSLTEITGNRVSITEGTTTRTLIKPPIAFTGFANMPAAAQMMMLRYWLKHRRPSQLPLLRANPQALPAVIHLAGHEAFTVNHETIRLTRYTIANLIFGREVFWMNDSNRIVAIMTFAGGLPQEFILDEYKPAFDQLIQSGVRQELLDLADIGRTIRPLVSTSFAIVGARLITATDAPAIEHSVVVIRKNIITAAGPAGTRIPAGIRIIHAEGKSLLPGLWAMHTHYSGIELGPALLAAGITTARDCGGEFQFLTAVRHAIEAEHAIGPRLLLAGLIDGPGPLAFGTFTADTPEEGLVAVDLYADAHFDQIDAYTHLQPTVLKAISAQAAKRNLTLSDCSADTDHSLPNLDQALTTNPSMTPLEAIQSLTIIPARAMHHDADSGTIEPGKRADLILIDGNPLANIADLTRVTSVITDGRLYNAKSLARSVAFTR